MFLISELHKIENPFSLFRQRAENFPIERMLCIDAYRINYVYQKMESQSNIAYLWENKIIMILDIGAPLDFRLESDFKITMLSQR